MDEIEKRLRDATDACLTSLENWNKQGKSNESREALMEAVHEVRKVISRVEIEIAISERDRLGSRPIPIPSHRSSRKGPGEENDYGDDTMNAPMEMPSMRQNMGESRRQNQNQNRGRRPMGQHRGGGQPHNPGNGNSNDGNGNTQDSE